jgi:alkylhydroperoxidase/carboxymuconolactone decarboxylase family protein YurZ
MDINDLDDRLEQLAMISQSSGKTTVLSPVLRELIYIALQITQRQPDNDKIGAHLESLYEEMTKEVTP